MLASKIQGRSARNGHCKLSLGYNFEKKKSRLDFPGHGENRSKTRKKRSREYILESEMTVAQDCTMDNRRRDGETVWLSIVECLSVTLRQQFSRGHIPCPQGALAISGGTADCHN